MDKAQRIVIIGGVAAGPKAAARARRLLPEAEITVVEQGEMISYGNCGLPLFLEGQIPSIKPLIATAAGVPRDLKYFTAEKKLNFHNRTRALKIRRQEKTVDILDLETGQESSLPYDQLVLATGSLPVIPPVPGTDLAGVTPLHHPSHAQLIMDAVKGGAQHIVIVGAGLVGLETAAALAGRGRSVVVLEREGQLMPGILDRELADLLLAQMQDNGVEFRLGAGLQSIQGDQEGQARKALTAEEEIPADLVILACGVRPQVDLARECGLTIGPTGAIQVDDHLLTSDPSIYAAGDCVQSLHLVSGKSVYGPMASTANKQGRVVGGNLAGRNEKFSGILGTMAMQVFEYNVAKTGLTEDQAIKAGFQVTATLSAGHDTAHYHPMHGAGVLKLICESGSGRILGAQAAGSGELIKRIDVLATAIHFGATADQVQNLDLCYAPPFSTPMDLAIHAANTWLNVHDGLARGITPPQLQGMISREEDFLILDVRTPGETKGNPLEDRRVLAIPLLELRSRIDEVPADKKIVTFCQLGVRAYEAARVLRGQGFGDVFFLEGGMFALPPEE